VWTVDRDWECQYPIQIDLCNYRVINPVTGKTFIQPSATGNALEFK
jgi:hypothetical protein